MKKLFIITLMIISLSLISGCSTTSVYIPDGQAVQLREKIKNAPIWVKTESGKLEPAIMDLPEGWYCLPDSEE